MKIAIYGRVSTRDKGQEVANQILQLTTFCESNKWTITHTYTDRKSGKNSDREEFKKMFAGARKREFDCVLFWGLDRFSREGVRETLNLLNELTSYGVGWKSYTEQYLDSVGVFKDAVLSILATVAKQERIRLSERVTAGLMRAKAQGHIGGRPKLIVNRELIRTLQAQGKSYRVIGKELNVSKSFVSRIAKVAIASSG